MAHDTAPVATVTPTAVESICISFVARSEAQGYKGKARDTHAINFVSGALAAFELVGDTARVNHLATWAAFVLQVRGYSEMLRVVAGWQTRRDASATV